MLHALWSDYYRFPINNGICSLLAGKCNFGVVPAWGICTLFLSPAVGHLQLFQHKMTDARGNGHAFNLLSHKSVKYPGFPKLENLLLARKAGDFILRRDAESYLVGGSPETARACLYKTLLSSP